MPSVDAEELRQRDEADFRVLGVDELEGLGDAVALHDLRLQRVVDAERLHRLDRGGSVRRGGRIGDRQFREGARLQRLLAPGHVDDLAPQDELADRVGEHGFREPRSPPSIAAFGRLGVGRQEHLERRVMGDLGEERAGGAEAQDRLVARLLLEQRGDFLRRLGEVGGDGDIGLAGLRGRGERRRECARTRRRACLEAST